MHRKAANSSSSSVPTGALPWIPATKRILGSDGSASTGLLEISRAQMVRNSTLWPKLDTEERKPEDTRQYYKVKKHSNNLHKDERYRGMMMSVAHLRKDVILGKLSVRPLRKADSSL